MQAMNKALKEEQRMKIQQQKRAHEMKIQQEANMAKNEKHQHK